VGFCRGHAERARNIAGSFSQKLAGSGAFFPFLSVFGAFWKKAAKRAFFRLNN